ncbi:MAG: hypothetical protein LQ339_007332 [Xanthoria mediterranea]|nr:MAG: hypothetical protein LQ339_007332 [Xanthoria mediterranea]
MDHAVSLQSDSPLFNRIPPEVRNEIFKLALTGYEDPKGRKYRVSAYYCRPGFTRAYKIDTGLLLTCRRVYWETCMLPASINEHTSWYWREPPGIKKNHLPIDNRRSSIIRRRGLRTIHVFAQQIWLEGDSFAGFTRLWQYVCPTTLIITLRHSDWWWWESEEPLTFDPKQEGKASIGKHSRPSDPFPPGSWGNQFRKIKGLRKLQLELETVDKKKPELDAIVDRAGGWEFTLGDERVLRLNKSKTRRTGWIGPWQAPHDRGGPEYEPEETISSEESHSPDNRETVDTTSVTETLNPDCSQDATVREMEAACESESARLRLRRTKLREAVGKLQAAGVAFDSMEPLGGPGAEKTSIYYVVHLTWET